MALSACAEKSLPSVSQALQNNQPSIASTCSQGVTGTRKLRIPYTRPGRVAMSSIGGLKQMRYLSNNEPAPPLLSEVYLADITDDDATVCRLAHHRSYGKNAKNGGYEPYFGEPHASISPTGTRIIFGSDWYDSGSVDSYVIELPDYKPPLVK